MAQLLWSFVAEYLADPFLQGSAYQLEITSSPQGADNL